MSYDSKVAHARQVVEQHNSNVTDNPVDFDKFLENLRNMGGSSDEALKAVSWEVLQECGLPKIMARRMSYIFRQDSTDGNGKSSAYVSSKKANMLTPKELLERYNPKDVKNSVGKRLKDISEGKAFVVFDPSGKINAEASAKLLEDIMSGLPEVSKAFVDGRPLTAYRIGDRPDAYADQNPLYPERPLRSGEECDQTGRSWLGVDVSIRQLLDIAITCSGELDITTVADANDVMDRVMAKGCTIDTLRSRYPHASQLFDEKERIGELPTLKIKLGKEFSKKNDPFGASNPRIF